MEQSKHLIEVIDISKDYAGDVALDHVNLYINDGEFLTLLGPSGCGKTTLLRCIAGFLIPSSGIIRMNGEDIAKVPPHKRAINTVFQKYALFPHLNVHDNIAFGLKIKKTPKDKIEEKSLITRIKNALDEGDYDLASELQIKLQLTVTELLETYSVYEKNLF